MMVIHRASSKSQLVMTVKWQLNAASSKSHDSKMAANVMHDESQLKVSAGNDSKMAAKCMMVVFIEPAQSLSW